ncbi:hypothetical protein FSP39_012001 [Pinctada imbricata]|uniref:Uncharacterized protein n=1 Tax=Pinctada imbricata TaxID=66713 RepID=A0AA88YKG1_PINIB|nr:hypothetical protein FSP39_012001 [Pinctada imbricata]
MNGRGRKEAAGGRQKGEVRRWEKGAGQGREGEIEKKPREYEQVDLPDDKDEAPTPKHPMQKHKANKHIKRRIRDKERQRTTQKHQIQRTTHKPTRPMGNQCRLRTVICHGNSRRCGYPGLRAYNPPAFPITQKVSKNVELWCKTTSSLSDDHTQTRPQNAGAQATQMNM